MIKKTIFLVLPAFIFLGLFGQIPPGYYDNAIGKSDTALQIALHDIIKGHTSISYSGLWTAYQTTDKRIDGKVWDMYSDCNFTFVVDQDQGSSGTSECQVFNREHSFPKSWFNNAAPMESDLFHVVPSDKKVNSIRGNYPYGEVNNPDYTSLNGSKRGTSSTPGYTGVVFEPADEYKGDFARIYFYMAVRYYTEDAAWPGSDMVNGSQLKPWALLQLYQWHLQDTVSQKEIDRNNAVYQIQGNRNPFIDRPDWVDSLWFPSSISIGNQPKTLEFKIYPNPAQNYFILELTRIQIKSKNLNLKILDATGRIIREQKIEISNKTQRIDIDNIPTGIYHVILLDDENIFEYQQLSILR